MERKKSIWKACRWRRGNTLYYFQYEGDACTDYRFWSIHCITCGKKIRTEKIQMWSLVMKNAETYQQQMASFGAVVGRNCNRIANAEIVIDGVTYQLEKTIMKIICTVVHRRLQDVCGMLRNRRQTKITFVIKDAEGQQGYPGNAVMKVTYEVTEANELSITYHATADKTTIFNMTNHAYFNLNGAGSGSAMEQTVLQIRASHYTPVMMQNPFRPVRLLRWMEHRLISGKQSRWAEILSRQMISFLTAMDTIIILFWIRSGQGLEKIATAYSTKSGIKMDVITDCIGMQLYTANFIQGQKVQGGAVCKERDAFCLKHSIFQIPSMSQILQHH